MVRSINNVRVTVVARRQCFCVQILLLRLQPPDRVQREVHEEYPADEKGLRQAFTDTGSQNQNE